MCETKCLILPKLDFKNIYILIFVLASLLQRLIPKIVEYFQDRNSLDNLENINITYYFDIMSKFFSDFLSGIIVLINKCKKEKHPDKITTSEGEKTVKNMKRFFCLIMPLIALCNFVGEICLFCFYWKYNDFYLDVEELFFIIFFDILFRYIFSRIFLKSFFYKHHYLSMILTTIGCIPLLIISMKNIFGDENFSDKKSNLILFFFLYLIKILLFSFQDILTKIALNKLLLRPYQLMFYKSLFLIIPLIGLSIPILLLDISDIKEFISDIILNFIIYRIVYIICGFFLCFSYITIIELVNPNHLSILKSLEFIAYFLNNTIWNFIQEKENNSNNHFKYLDYIFEFFSFIILIFGACIHNEMIIIKKWGFYECTDYYKTEVKGFSNIDVDFSEDKTAINKDFNKDDNSLIDNNSLNNDD